MIKNTALILEGGGFRGMYTAGILEVFLEKQLFFESVYGISAGAAYGVSYVSQQPGRNLAVNKFIGDKRYCSFRNLVKKGSMFSWDFIYEEIPQKIIPFDYKALQSAPSKLHVGTSNCLSGESEFFILNNADKTEFKTILSATGSLPLIAPIVNYQGKQLLDGGLTDSVPYDYAFQNGSQKAVVILTQPKGYRKSPLKGDWFFKAFYRKHPKVYEMLKNRPEQYNASIEKLETREKEGRVFVIRPEQKLKVSRLENKPEKTEAAYRKAMEQARAVWPHLQQWLQTG